MENLFKSMEAFHDLAYIISDKSLKPLHDEISQMLKRKLQGITTSPDDPKDLLFGLNEHHSNLFVRDNKDELLPTLKKLDAKSYITLDNMIRIYNLTKSMVKDYDILNEMAVIIDKNIASFINAYLTGPVDFTVEQQCYFLSCEYMPKDRDLAQKWVLYILPLKKKIYGSTPVKQNFTELWLELFTKTHGANE